MKMAATKTKSEELQEDQQSTISENVVSYQI